MTITALTPALLLAFSFAACAPIHNHVQGWPQDMKISVHVIPESEIFKRCFVSPQTFADALFMQLPIACAWTNLDKNTCDVYVSPTTTKDTLEHELEHCRGGDHGGKLKCYYDTWIAKKK
jgi:hypothetical protein